MWLFSAAEFYGMVKRWANGATLEYLCRGGQRRNVSTPAAMPG